MHVELMMDDVFVEALPWLLWSIGFAIIYIISAAVDDDKTHSNEQ
ncbi:hypothetical protein BvCmsC16A_04170 [Escherichia coli]|nr:hypothetical protein BvCms16BK_04776 [Escherichia coli]GCK64189.1 hypothetical protein BvCmsC16A_04170 [Escherichia coli]